MQIKRFVLGVFATNTYLLEKDNKCILIDPASKSDKLIDILGDKKLVAILLTHGHLDHIKAVDGLYKKYKCPIYLNEFDEALARDKSQGIKFGLDISSYISCPITYLKEGPLTIDNFNFEVIFTPGHTKGSVCYIIDNCLFSGDTLFKLSAGRTDLDSGSEKDLRKSLKILKGINSNLIVYPGHEEESSLDFEKDNNPYFRNL